MRNSDTTSSNATPLRQRAEELLANQQESQRTPADIADMLKLIHELQVHQVELELQNEELILAKQQEELAKDKYTKLYDYTPSGLLTLTSNGDICELNFRAASMLGKDRSGLLNNRFSLFISSEFRSVFNTFIDRVRSRASMESCEVSLDVKNRNSIFVTIEGVYIADSKLIYLTLVDISERKYTETILFESEEQFRSYFDNSPVGEAIVDLNTRFVRCNPALCAFLGYPESELIGKSMLDFTHHDDNVAGFPEMRMLLDAKIRSASFEKRFYRKNGTVVYGEVFISVVRDVHNAPSYFLPIIQDITERKRFQDEIRTKGEELLSLNVQKDKLFSIIAHDLKTPFNSIIGLSQILVEYVREGNYAALEDIATIIYDSSNSAMDLLNNLMEWAQLQTGRKMYSPEDFKLPALVHDVTSMYNSIAMQKSISITTVCPQHITLCADHAMIGTVLRNLVSNAIKFTNTGGKILITAEENPSEVVISVKDDGIGMPEACIESLFRVGESISRLGTKMETGTGLGLILCKEFVEKHGGKLWVESSLTTGSCFHFSLPKYS